MAIEVFAADSHTLQLVWDRLPTPDTVIEVAGRSFGVGGPPPEWYPGAGGGPGALLVEDLEPATAYDVTVVAGGRSPSRSLAVTARTAAAPPGRELCRFATFSDCHIGERHFGAVVAMRDPGAARAGLDPYPVRALRAAGREAIRWGAQRLVVRGDLTRWGHRSEAVTAAAELTGTGVPALSVLGNHDVAGPADIAGVLRGHGVDAAGAGDPLQVDLPGVRLVLGHTPVPGHHGGRLAPRHLDRLVSAVGDAPGPAVLVLHHPPRTGRIPTYYPPPLDLADSRSLVQRAVDANPAVLVLAGHTHRTRRYQLGGLAVSEVGSTKDYPGQWAGYTVYEGGISQTARRTSAPDVIAWTEITRRALGGLWGRWSPGRAADRSWTYAWPAGRSGA